MNNALQLNDDIRILDGTEWHNLEATIIDIVDTGDERIPIAICVKFPWMRYWVRDYLGDKVELINKYDGNKRDEV